MVIDNYIHRSLILRGTPTRVISLLSILVILGLSNLCFAQDVSTTQEIGIDEKLGNMVPLDLTFKDEEGKSVVLKDLVGDKPFVLSLNYYHCPGICDTQLAGIADVLDSVNMKPGVDFHVITISFDPTDTPEIALQKKSTFYTSMKHRIPDNAWYFLTGTPENIKKITEATGFEYKKVKGGYFLHSGALIAISPTGKIARYMYGLDYLPFDLQMAMVEASQGKTGPTINRLLRYCFSYEPQGKKYVFNILLVTGVTSSLFGLGFLAFLIGIMRKKRKSKGVNHNA